jgi:antitoxin HicB
VILERDPQAGYVVLVPALQGCATQGATMAEALHNAEEAAGLYVEDLVADGEPIPEDVPEVRVALGVTPEAYVTTICSGP